MPKENESKNWPATVNEAAEIVYKPLSDEFKRDFISEDKEKSLAQFHSTMGRRIRNKFGLWQNNDALMKATNSNHADEASWVIMRVVYDKCKEYLNRADKYDITNFY